MAIKVFSTGSSAVQVKAQGAMQTATPGLEGVPGGVFPIRLSHFVMDEYRIANGWPVPVPEGDISAEILVSGEGEVLAFRDDPLGVQTGAFVRWVPDEDAYDITDLRWFPVVAEYPSVLETSPDYAPTLITDYEYRHGAEVFSNPALNFDADSAQHMWLDLNALGGSPGYSVIMLASFNSVYGNSETPYSGIWCPRQNPFYSLNPLDGWMSVTLQGTSFYLETDQTRRTRVLSASNLISSSTPMMLAMTFGRPFTTFYASTGPDNIVTGSVATGEIPTALHPNIFLGRTPEDLLHTADMALLDLGIYAGRLTPDQVQQEFALLAGAYGGSR